MNLDAPKVGTFNFGPSQWVFNQNPYTFNTLNSFVAKGDAPPRMEMCFDSLMTSALDEPDSIYGLVAKTVTVSPDRNSFEFDLQAGGTISRRLAADRRRRRVHVQAAQGKRAIQTCCCRSPS